MKIQTRIGKVTNQQDFVYFLKLLQI